MKDDPFFDRFWSIFPRKVAKLEAIKAWKQMTREYDPEEIIAGLERNLESLQRRERQFIPHPATWLRAGRWMDEVEVPSTFTGHSMIDSLLRMQ